MKFRIKQGDTRKALKLQLLGNADMPVNLESAVVELIVKGITNDTHFIRQASHLSETGWVMIPLREMHTENAGIYKAEVKVTFPDGLIETFPTIGTFEIHIESRLNV